jgi:foldase protein PrsA
MAPRIKVALLVAALSLASILAACRQFSAPPAEADRTPLPASPAAESTPDPATRGSLEAVLTTTQWPTGPVVARVNGVEILAQTYREEVTRQLRLITLHYEIDWSDEEHLSHLPLFLDQEIENMITMELLRQIAAQNGITISDEDLQSEIQSIRQDVLAGGFYENLEAFLEAGELTQERFEFLVRQQMLGERMLHLYGGPTAVEQVRARHILVDDEETAQQVLEKIEEGIPFADVAKVYSTDDGSSQVGGDLGWFPRGLMVPEFDKAVFALQPGETSGIVKTGFGYHVIRVDERGVRELEEPILGQIRQSVFADWLDARRQEANIEKLYDPLAGSAPAP